MPCPKGTTATLGFEAGTSGMGVCGLIHSAATAPQDLKRQGSRK